MNFRLPPTLRHAALTLLAATCLGAAAQSHWTPRPGTSWQIQLQGRIDTSVDAQVYDIDLFDTPQATIDTLHARGVKVICYFNAGGWEDWRPDAAAFPATVLGGPLDGWPGERWLDIRRITQLAPVMGARLDLAVAKGCDAVDPDNLDGYSNATGLPLKPRHQLVYNRWIADEAHRRGLGVGLKNDLAQIPALVDAFDFAVNEQCVQYGECDRLTPFIQAGKPVFGIEYSGPVARACRIANGLNFDTLIKPLSLGPARRACR